MVTLHGEETKNVRIAQGFSGQRILVTGARGFIGSHLCRCLHESGVEVYAVSRTIPVVDTDGLHHQQVDISDIETGLVT